LPLYREDNIYI